jgi:hypothetical protein
MAGPAILDGCLILASIHPTLSLRMLTHHRTWQVRHIARILVTIELDPIADSHATERHRGLAVLTKRLVECFDSHRLPATWAVNDPAHSAATSLLMRSAVPHELAILGDPNWLGSTAGRTRFARELARRVSQARASGINVRSLVPRVESVQRHIDLVVKQQLTAVAGIRLPSQATFPWPVPHVLHYGVWEIPVCDRLPRRSLWFFEGGWSVRRKIGRAARDAATFHFTIDAPLLEQEGRRAENSLVSLLGRIAKLRDRGLIQVETLASAAARLADRPTVIPQRSILRAA